MEPIVFDLKALGLSSIVPMLIMLGGGLFILVADLFKVHKKEFYVIISMGVIMASVFALLSIGEVGRGFFDVMYIDGLALMAQLIILVGSLMITPLAFSGQTFAEYKFAEYFAFFLFMIAGFQFMASSDNLILIFIGLETASLSLYTLIALHNRDKSFESAIKYFTMGAYGAGFFAFGSLIFYAMTGSVEIHQIKDIIVQSNYEHITLILLGTIFMLTAIGFKLSLVPFHTWTPDVYEGAAAPLAGYMAIVPKIAGFVVALRFFEFLIANNDGIVSTILWILAVATMTIGNVSALVQHDVKRMLAYSSISHAGFIIAAILINTNQSHIGMFLYWGLFLFASVGAFSMLWISRHPSTRHHIRYDHPFEKFAGMIKLQPVGAVIMGIFMLALAGVPPFAVYWGKIYIISSALNAGFFYLAIIMVLNSAVAAYYYLKLIVFMFLKDPSQNDGTLYITNKTLALKGVLTVAAIVVILSIFTVEPLLNFVQYHITSSGY